MSDIIKFPVWKPIMETQLSEEQKKVINELTIKVSSDIPAKEIEYWVRSLSEDMQILVSEALDVMNKNFDALLKLAGKEDELKQLLIEKGLLNETNS